MTKKDTRLLVISSFPPKGQTHHRSIVGGASYTKNILLNFPQDISITVLGEQNEGKENSYQDGKINVRRIWKRNSFLSFFQLAKYITISGNDTKDILFSFELSMFGHILHLLPMPFFLLWLRITGKRVNLIIHQAITDFKEVSGHINLKGDDFRIKIYNLLILLFYKLIFINVSRVIVFEEAFKIRLQKITRADILVIPHGVEKFNNPPSKEKARSLLGLPSDKFIVLNFGFLAWYKGTDQLIESFKKDAKKKDSPNISLSQSSHICLVIAGGPNPNHLDKPFYRDYVAKIENDSRRQNITLTGFVPEDQIPAYFQAADLVVFPYRTLMASSGPLSITFSFGKPFLISEKMLPLTLTKDIKDYLYKSKLPKETFVFRTQKELFEKICSLKSKKDGLRKIALISKKLALERGWRKIGEWYQDVIFQ